MKDDESRRLGLTWSICGGNIGSVKIGASRILCSRWNHLTASSPVSFEHHFWEFLTQKRKKSGAAFSIGKTPQNTQKADRSAHTACQGAGLYATTSNNLSEKRSEITSSASIAGELTADSTRPTMPPMAVDVQHLLTGKVSENEGNMKTMKENEGK